VVRKYDSYQVRSVVALRYISMLLRNQAFSWDTESIPDVWNGTYFAGRVKGCANATYRAGRTKDVNKVIVMQMVRDVHRIDVDKDAKFSFPLRGHYDRAFDAPERWLDSTWREKPAVCQATASSTTRADTVDEMLGPRLMQVNAGQNNPLDDVGPFLLLAQDSPQSTPAVVIPSGDGLVTIRPAIVTAIDLPDAVHDAEAELNADEVAALEAMSNLHEFAYERWMTEVLQGRVGEWFDGKREGDGPPNGAGCR
jgi:hypothetical protein